MWYFLQMFYLKYKLFKILAVNFVEMVASNLCHIKLWYKKKERKKKNWVQLYKTVFTVLVKLDGTISIFVADHKTTYRTRCVYYTGLYLVIILFALKHIAMWKYDLDEFLTDHWRQLDRCCLFVGIALTCQGHTYHFRLCSVYDINELWYCEIAYVVTSQSWFMYLMQIDISMKHLG